MSSNGVMISSNGVVMGTNNQMSLKYQNKISTNPFQGNVDIVQTNALHCSISNLHSHSGEKQTEFLPLELSNTLKKKSIKKIYPSHST